MFFGKLYLWILLVLVKLNTVENLEQIQDLHNLQQGQNITSLYKLSNQYMNLFKDYQRMNLVEQPDLTNIQIACPRTELFCSLNPSHMEAVTIVKSILDATNTTENFFRVAKELRNREEIHPRVWYQAVTSYAYNNPELQRIPKPTALEFMPDLFINSPTLQKARFLEKQPISDNKQSCVTLDETVGVDNGLENKLWYFREDLMLNSHHWFWHLIYPIEVTIEEDRRGELFYYFHNSLLARYKTERISCDLGKVLPFNLVKNGIIEEGYKSHLTDEVTGLSWVDRKPNSLFTDIIKPTNPGRNVDVNKMLINTTKMLLEGIDRGYLQEVNGSQIQLKSNNGIDILGNTIQRTPFGINMNLYGGGRMGIHNNGHFVFSLVMDPNGTLKLPAGVILDSAISMRDPIFYRWHAFIDDVFQHYIKTLPPHEPNGGDHPLEWPGISIQHASVTLAEENRNKNISNSVNHLHTFWNEKSFRLTRGLDFQRPHGSNPLEICVKHLDHENFNYNFIIHRDEIATSASSATVRIFLAPRFDEFGNRFSMEDQRSYFFILDTFTAKLSIGFNNITRRSTESTLTIPWTKSLTEVEASTAINTHERLDTVPFCGCGFPQHLLLPRGKPSGMIFDLFIMVTNAEEDFVQGSEQDSCYSAPLHCGLPGRKYPDAKPMGYPFDRLPYKVIRNSDGAGTPTRPVETLEDYVAGVSNMKTIQVVVTHDESFRSVGQ